MRYYLDTSAIYEIKKLPKSVKDDCFYSVFSVIEIIAGLNQNSFEKRKAALTNLRNAGVKYDDTFPEKLVLRSFDHFDLYELEEERLNDLFGLVDDLLAVSSFEEFLAAR
jgi:hypothetical protein